MNKAEILQELVDAAKAAKVRLHENGPGHYHIIGARLVNYYPFSKYKSAYAHGQVSLKHVTPAEACDMALEEPIGAPPPENAFTIFGCVVTEAEFRAHEMPESDEKGPPWK